MIVFAHAGHWLVNLMYAMPVVALAGYIAWDHLRARRARARGEDPRGRPLPAGASADDDAEADADDS